MVVDERVAAALQRASWPVIDIFVAGCVERSAQLFTGLRGGRPDRERDLDVYIEVIGDHWDLHAAPEKFSRNREILEGFIELEPDGEPFVDAIDIYSFYGVLVAHEACTYRADRSIEAALEVAHASLTAMGQLDQNSPGGAFMPEEHDEQISYSQASELGMDRIAALRSESQKIGAKRIGVLQQRLGGQ